ncbi:hypothetical protein HPB50_011710 [Hyalomma asiaticum]|uniref:Uncharacterized protein n=1 Tax=Hyalomma asiaticum TaxID=266040 RepID=A0ACB7SH36_HYAAI|nr:hypothetical protein HPB50_011710 [Hyalomma asiaticum]
MDHLFTFPVDAECGLYLVGSSLNGFGSRQSDADMCLVISDNQESQGKAPLNGEKFSLPVQVDQQRQATTILSRVARLLARTEPGGGWIQRFKERHGIVYKNMVGEAASLDSQAKQHWLETNLPALMERFSDKDISLLKAVCFVYGTWYKVKQSTIQNCFKKPGSVRQDQPPPPNDSWCVGGRPQVIHAKVPIVRFRDRTTGVEVDMNVNNVVGLRNTRLLQCYAQLDPRTAPLVLAVKAWASGQHINEAKNGTLSSYSLALMVIQYLQCGCEPAVLPSLQKMQPSLGTLFVGFLDFFANRFGFSRSCASVRLGVPISRLEAISATSTERRSQWKYICIEEPFDKSNTARAVYNWETYQQIVRAFHDTLEQLHSTHSPECLLLPP